MPEARTYFLAKGTGVKIMEWKLLLAEAANVKGIRTAVAARPLVCAIMDSECTSWRSEIRRLRRLSVGWKGAVWSPRVM